jgi:hypothetical protein
MTKGKEKRPKNVKQKVTKPKRTTPKYFTEFVVFFVVFIALILDFLLSDCLAGLEQGDSDIIIILLPLVLTILSITLSLPKELIYGVDKTDFRKLRGPKTYSFLEMLTITICLLVVYGFSKIFHFLIVFWILDIISVIYSLVFLTQEIPMLMHDKSTIMKVLKKNIDSITREPNVDIALQNILLNDGIRDVYFYLKGKNPDRNRQYIDLLLDLQNIYLDEYIDNHTLVIQGISYEYKHIEILQAINRSINNVNDVLSFNKDLNIIEIYGDENHFYHITRSLFFLHKILIELKFDRKFQRDYSDIIKSIFMKIDFENSSIDEKRFLYKTLNAMIISSLSSNDLWFIELLRDSAYNDINTIYGSDAYMVFVSIYLFNLAKVDPRSAEDLKSRISAFAKSSSNGIYGIGASWSNVLKHKLEYLDLKEITSILPEMLLIYDSNPNSFSWYESHRSGVTISSTSMFTKEKIINWWIGYVLSNENLFAYSLNSQQNMALPQLNEKEADLLAVELNKNWFDDDKLKPEVDLSIFDFFGVKASIQHLDSNSNVVSTLRVYKNARIKAGISTEIDEHVTTPETLSTYKTILSDGLMKAIENFPYIDRTIDLENEEMKCFKILFDTRWSESLVKAYSEKMPESLRSLIYSDFISNPEISAIKRPIDQYNEQILHEIVDFQPTAKNAYIYDFVQSDQTEFLLNKIRPIPSIDKMWLPHDLFIRANAIGVNIEYVEEPSFVRRLTHDEINTIIDRDYKLINGLYKYVEGANGDRSVLLTREEIGNIVNKKFFFACLVFRYKAEYKVNDILFFDKTS